MRITVLLAFSFVAALLFQGSRGLYETSEGRYAECAREMAERGSWLEPVLNGKTHWTKPPLTYWAIRLPYSVLGANAWAARLYLIPCYLMAVWAAWRLALALWNDPQTARLSAMIYATSGLSLVASQTVTTDYPLAAAVALAQASFWTALRQKSRRAIYALWLFMGVAFMAKGPPALLFLPAMVAVWLRLPRSERARVPLFAPLGLLVFFIVGFGWYAWEAYRHTGLMNYWLHDEVVERSFSEKFNRNASFYRNFLIYLPVLVFGAFPWTGWLIWRGRAVWRRLRAAGLFSGRTACLSDQTLWLVWSLGFPLVVFMLSHSKLPLYLLPLFVAVAAAVARLLTAVYGMTTLVKKRVFITWLATLALFVVTKGVYARWPSDHDMGQLYRCLVRDGTVGDFSRVTVVGNRAFNGLSYYCGRDIPFVPFGGLSQWDGGAAPCYLICKSKYVHTVEQRLIGKSTAARRLDENWQLITVTRHPEALAP